MSGLRAWLRLLVMALASIVIGVVVVLQRIVLVPFARPGRRLSLRVTLRLQQLWARVMLAVMGVRVKRPAGRPPRGCLIASNHLSYLDIPVIASVVPCRFVSKAEVAQWPVVGWLARIAHVLFLDRGRKRDVLHVGASVRETLESGVTVTFFPEGTSGRGAEVGPFHPGLLEPAAATGSPCVAFALHYETPGDLAAPACTICWWGDMAFLPHAWNLMKLRRIDATVRWSEELLRSDDRKALAAALHREVSRLFVPVRQDSQPPVEFAVSR